MSLGEAARNVFHYWKEVTKHPKSCLDDKRMRVLTARLRDGYSEEDLKLASLGCAFSRFHQGENDAHKIYDSIELIYRNADKVDQFIRLGEEELRRRKRLENEKKAQDEERLRLSVMGDSYKAARSRILSVVKKA